MLNKILKIYTKLFAVWVIVFAVVAYFCPKPFDIKKEVMLCFFALTMFGIGAVLDPKDFKNIAKNPMIVLIGCVSQFVLMPVGAFILAKAFHLSAPLAVGLILTASAPGAMSSNVICYIAKADTAYSVSLTSVATLLCPVLTPLLTLFLAKSYLPIAFLPMFTMLMLTVIVPLLCGFAVKVGFKKQTQKLQNFFPAISVTFIILICSAVIAKNRDNILEATMLILTAVVILNIYGLTAGYCVGSVFKMNAARRRTLAIEIGMQNAGLGTVLATVHFANQPAVAIPAAVFVFVCIITAAIMVEFWNRNNKAKQS